jgi:hypothetical protein
VDVTEVTGPRSVAMSGQSCGPALVEVVEVVEDDVVSSSEPQPAKAAAAASAIAMSTTGGLTRTAG